MEHIANIRLYLDDGQYRYAIVGQVREFGTDQNFRHLISGSNDLEDLMKFTANGIEKELRRQKLKLVKEGD